jgi:energy-coupling factor transporter ATP-binding protein EcfA2
MERERPDETASNTRVTSVAFHRYKALRDFSVAFEHITVLVGPNNSGKSTVIGAFRVLSVALARAWARRPEAVRLAGAYRTAYRVPDESIPISLENVHTDYEERPSSIVFRLSNGLRLTLEFPEDEGCFLVPDVEGPVILGPAQFRRVYPLQLGVVPVLGSVEHEEPLVLEETVRRGLVSHLASRHFRSFWFHFPHDFEHFRALLTSTWPDVDILRPELAGPGRDHVAMFCVESRMTRELFWAGFGFQVWCQILSHLVRMQGVSLVVIDEPEIYLHPDLQRRLVSLLRDLGPDVLLATHSSEIVTEVEPSDIVIVDKTKTSGRRVAGISGVQKALDAIGSIQNVVLAQLARTRRVLFVEGDDFKILRRFAAKLGLGELANAIGLTTVPLGGFPDPAAVRALSAGIEMALGERVAFAGVFDRDYRSQDEVEAVELDLEQVLAYTHIYGRKELENFLLSPTVLQRAIDRTVGDRARRTGEAGIAADAAALLEKASEPYRIETQSQLVASATKRRSGDRRDPATINRDVMETFEERWKDLELRLGLAPGKRVLADFNQLLRSQAKISLSVAVIVDAFHTHEIPFELATVVREIDGFRRIDADRIRRTAQ